MGRKQVPSPTHNGKAVSVFPEKAVKGAKQRSEMGASIVRTKSASSYALSAIPDCVGRTNVWYRNASDGHESSRKLGDVTTAAPAGAAPWRAFRVTSPTLMVKPLVPRTADVAGPTASWLLLRRQDGQTSSDRTQPGGSPPPATRRP
jgi:hypothetical protein